MRESLWEAGSVASGIMKVNEKVIGNQGVRKEKMREGQGNER